MKKVNQVYLLMYKNVFRILPLLIDCAPFRSGVHWLCRTNWIHLPTEQDINDTVSYVKLCYAAVAIFNFFSTQEKNKILCRLFNDYSSTVRVQSVSEKHF